MKTYNHTGVNYWTDIFSDLKSFDIRSTGELEELNTKLIEYFKDHSEKRFVHFIPGMQHTVFKKLRGDYFYLELPYEFFNEHLVAWRGDICILPLINDHRPCDCYMCSLSDEGKVFSHDTWAFVKDKILKGETWKQIFRNSVTGEIVKMDVHRQPNHPEMYETFRNYGVAKPIYNYSDTIWPSVGTHRIAYCSVLKSDVPLFFRILHPKHGAYGEDNRSYERYKSRGLVRDDQYVYFGTWPYFKDKKYCILLITPELKKVEFYLSFHQHTFDEDRDEKVGEIIYK